MFMLLIMIPRQLIWPLLTLTMVACAGQTYQGNVGPMFARARGEIALAGSANNGRSLGPANSIDNDMGLGQTEASPYIEFQTDIDKHRIRANGFYLDSDSSGQLSNAYGNIAPNTITQTSMQFFAIASNYSYEVLREDAYRVGLGGQLAFYSLDVSARSPGGREEVTTEVLVPMPYIEAEAYWQDFTVGASSAIMAGDFGDARGRYWDLEAFGTWHIDERYDLKIGYRYLLLDGNGRASERDFDADVNVQGMYITGGFRF
jgi:hypothetical protein